MHISERGGHMHTCSGSAMGPRWAHSICFAFFLFIGKHYSWECLIAGLYSCDVCLVWSSISTPRVERNLCLCLVESNCSSTTASLCKCPEVLALG